MNPTYTPPVDQDWIELPSRASASSDPLIVLSEDQSSRWNAGNPVPVEEYFDHFPDLSEEDALVLILAEIGLRRERGEKVTPDEYQSRFPQHRDDLALQF